jgi:hypothetical protein
MTITRGACLVACAAAALASPLAVQAQALQVVTSLLPAPGTLPAFGPWLDHAEHALADHDLTGLGFVAQPRGQVGDAADRGVFEPLLEADLAERRIAERDADAEARLWPRLRHFCVSTPMASRISTAIFTARCTWSETGSAR